MLCVGEDVWDGISEADRGTFLKLAAKWRDEERRMIREADSALVEEIRKKGVDVREVDKAPFREAVQPVWKSFEPVFGEDLMKLIREAGE